MLAQERKSSINKKRADERRVRITKSGVSSPGGGIPGTRASSFNLERRHTDGLTLIASRTAV